MTQSDMFQCPIEGCPWTYTAPALFELPEGITPDQLQTQSAERTRGIEAALSGHFDTHPAVDWAREVSRLRGLLLERPPLVCALCFVDRHKGRLAGQPLPPQNLGQLIVNGASVCPEHVTIVDGPPPTPGRTAGGLIVPGT